MGQKVGTTKDSCSLKPSTPYIVALFPPQVRCFVVAWPQRLIEAEAKRLRLVTASCAALKLSLLRVSSAR